MFTNEVLNKLSESTQAIGYALSNIDQEKEAISDILTDASAVTGIDKKIIRKLATSLHKRNIQEQQEEFNQFLTLYEEMHNAQQNEEAETAH